MTFRLKYVTFDCHGALTRFRMGEISRELFTDRGPAESMEAVIADFSCLRFDEVLGARQPHEVVLKDAVRRLCTKWKIQYFDAVAQKYSSAHRADREFHHRERTAWRVARSLQRPWYADVGARAQMHGCRHGRWRASQFLSRPRLARDFGHFGTPRFLAPVGLYFRLKDKLSSGANAPRLFLFPSL